MNEYMVITSDGRIFSGIWAGSAGEAELRVKRICLGRCSIATTRRTA